MGVTALVTLLWPMACIKEEDPRPFSTADSCYPGDVEDCVCEADGQAGTPGTRACPKSRHFADSPCDCPASSGTGGSK